MPMHYDSLFSTLYKDFNKFIIHQPISRIQGRRVDSIFKSHNANGKDGWLKSSMIPFYILSTKQMTRYTGWRHLLERYTAHLNHLIFLGKSLKFVVVHLLTQT